jgi:hypothetical protein
VPQAAAWAVLATQAYTPHHCGNHTQGWGRPSKRAQVNCKGGLHPNVGHSEEDCWTLHPEKFEEAMQKQASPPTTGLLTTAADESQMEVRPLYGYLTNAKCLPQGDKVVLDLGASTPPVQMDVQGAAPGQQPPQIRAS